MWTLFFRLFVGTGTSNAAGVHKQGRGAAADEEVHGIGCIHGTTIEQSTCKLQVILPLFIHAHTMCY